MDAHAPDCIAYSLTYTTKRGTVKGQSEAKTRIRSLVDNGEPSSSHTSASASASTPAPAPAPVEPSCALVWEAAAAGSRGAALARSAGGLSSSPSNAPRKPTGRTSERRSVTLNESPIASTQSAFQA
jgi:hypothetical protein